jgi:predicted AlkP superfamily phosphohydrolase/phosphomutase
MEQIERSSRAVLAARPGNLGGAGIWFVIVMCVVLSLIILSVVTLYGSGQKKVDGATRRVIVLAIDAMDYHLSRQLMNEGLLPNFTALGRRGSFAALTTSMPPLSPVAWTNFITGMNPGGHGVFDFLRRDPLRVKDGFLPEDGVVQTMIGAAPRERRIPFTSYVWPHRKEQVLLRSGQPFWDMLTSRGVEATIYKMPANFPVASSQARILSGMGTPDIEGSYGTFTFVTARKADWNRRITGGRILRAEVVDGIVSVKRQAEDKALPYLRGPVNPFLSKELSSQERYAEVPFEVFLDREENAAAIVIQGRDIVLKQGDWSRWVEVRFDLLPPLKAINGLVRFYLQEVCPSFRLFVSPVNLAPGTEGLATQAFDIYLQNGVGPFYTKGMSEQTKGLTEGILSLDEYLAQSDLVLQDRVKALQFLLSEIDRGLLFFYVSTLDLDSHVMQGRWDSSFNTPQGGDIPGSLNLIVRRYQQMDQILGKVLSKLGSRDVLYVISDHGFAPFHREFNLPRWLEMEGYLVYQDPIRARISECYSYVNWEKTLAYGVGYNGLFLNLKGREAKGLVLQEDYERLREEIRSRLLKLRDTNGKRVFRSVYRKEDIYSGARLLEAPDLILGYDRGYGPSDESVLGTWCEEVISPHERGFTGHHLVDYRLVPGVLFSTRKLRPLDARLEDVTVTLLREFGISPALEMTGKALY